MSKINSKITEPLERPENGYSREFCMGRSSLRSPSSQIYMYKIDPFGVFLYLYSIPRKKMFHVLLLATKYIFCTLFLTFDILGGRDVFTVKSADEVFDILERLLWDHANKVCVGLAFFSVVKREFFYMY